MHPLCVLPWLSMMGECPESAREHVCTSSVPLGPHPSPQARPRPRAPAPASLPPGPALAPSRLAHPRRVTAPAVPALRHAPHTRRLLTCSMLRPLRRRQRAGPRGVRGRRPLHAPRPGSCTRRPRATPGAPGLLRPSPPLGGLRPAADPAPPRASPSPPRPRWGLHSTSSHFAHGGTGDQLRAEPHTRCHTHRALQALTHPGDPPASAPSAACSRIFSAEPREDPCHFPEALASSFPSSAKELGQGDQEAWWQS